MIVVDASIAAKWFLEEPLSSQASDLLFRHAGEVAGPDMLAIEVSGVLVRNANAVKPSRAHIVAALDKFNAMLAGGDVTLHRSSAHSIRNAADMAIRIGHPLKDCIYLALAMELGCELVTCDARFAAKAKVVWAGVRVLGDEVAEQ